LLLQFDYQSSKALQWGYLQLLIHDGGTKEIKINDELKFWGYIPETA